MQALKKAKPVGPHHDWMLIKLRNIFYQVECDAFAILAIELLDIQPNIRRPVALARKPERLTPYCALEYGTVDK